VEKEIIKTSPMFGIQKPKVPKNVSQKTINEEQLCKVFKAHREDIREKRRLRQITTRSQFRIWFRPVVSIAYYGGLRVKEVVYLKWDNIDFKRRQITITETKSGDERVVPIRKELLLILKAWKRFDRYGGNGLVFPSETGFDAMQKMSEGNISRVFREYVDIAKLPSTINFHGLRHSCGTELMRMGYDINEVAKILGHSTLQVTRIYEHLTANDLSSKMIKSENEISEQEKKQRSLAEKEKMLLEWEKQLTEREKGNRERV
jgi:integrase